MEYSPVEHRFQTGSGSCQKCRSIFITVGLEPIEAAERQNSLILLATRRRGELICVFTQHR